MNSLFEIGQKVVCVDSKSRSNNGLQNQLIEGKQYTVLSMINCSCGDVGIDVGLSGFGSICSCGAKYAGKIYCSQTRFVPLDFDRQADEAIHEALKEDLKIKI